MEADAVEQVREEETTGEVVTEDCEMDDVLLKVKSLPPMVVALHRSISL